MAAAQKKAVDLMAKGEKCLTKFSFFGGGSQKYEDAAECFQDAGKMFVLAKSFDEAGRAWVPNDALPVALECLFSPPPEWLRPSIESREFFNPYTDTTQFYLAGHTRIELPAGLYSLRVYKGNEYYHWRE